MIRRPNLITVLASAVFLSATLPAAAFSFPGSAPAERAAPGFADPVPGRGEAPVVLAQAGDSLSRIQRLEDEVRRLNGRVEELSFQLLQAQEDMRKAQENNEFRFQDLEGGPGSAGSGDNLAPQQRGDLGSPQGPDAGSRTAGTSALGGADFSGLGGETGSTSQGAASSGSSGAASSGQSANVYNNAYDQLLAGDYPAAEQSFRQYVQTYPDSADASDAEYWLGESLYQQQRYADAAEIFLNAQKEHPDAAKAPDMMLKLGMSLAALGNDETACITYKEVSNRYPQMSDALRRKLGEEEKSASC